MCEAMQIRSVVVRQRTQAREAESAGTAISTAVPASGRRRKEGVPEPQTANCMAWWRASAREQGKGAHMSGKGQSP